MESKLLAGGKNIFDKTNEQERELEKQRQVMIDQKVRTSFCGELPPFFPIPVYMMFVLLLLHHQKKERAMQQELLAKEETTMEMKETYTSFQEEVDHKTKKLNKVRTRACGETPTGGEGGWSSCVHFVCVCVFSCAQS